MAFALVANIAVSGNVNSGTTGTFNPTGANLLTGNVACGFNAGTPAVSDNKGNSWTARTQYSRTATFLDISQIFYAKNPTVGSGQTATVTTTAQYPSLYVTAWSGADTTAPYDVENGGGATGTTVQPGSVTPSQANSLLITGLMQEALTADALSTGSGFTITDQTNNVSGQAFGGGQAYFVQGSAAAINPTWTAAVSSGLIAAIAVFKPAVASGKMFLPLSFDGLGAGGPFFSNRLAA